MLRGFGARAEGRFWGVHSSLRGRSSLSFQIRRACTADWFYHMMSGSISPVAEMWPTTQPCYKWSHIQSEPKTKEVKYCIAPAGCLYWPAVCWARRLCCCSCCARCLLVYDMYFLCFSSLLRPVDSPGACTRSGSCSSSTTSKHSRSAASCAGDANTGKAC